MKATDNSPPVRQGDGSAWESLGELYTAHYRLLRSAAQSWGLSPDDAMDLVQEFFLRSVQKGYFERFDGSRGKLRTFVLTLFQRFETKQRSRQQALKRGGGARLIPLDAPLTGSPASSELLDWRSPEALAAREFAENLLNNTMQRLRNELRRDRKLQLFETLLPSLLHEPDRSSYASLYRKTHLSEPAARMTVSRYRRRLRALLLEELAALGITDGEASEEVRWLIQILSRTRLGSTATSSLR
jgi:DNA-directed RNA polymerase specialized sigma24 family protein